MNQKGSDIGRSCTGSFLFIGGIIFSLIGLGIGWLAWDWRTGLICALAIFATFFAASMITFLTIEDPSSVAASMPMALSVLYTVGPDFPGPVDDSIVQFIGSMLTFIMWKRRDDRFPTWAIIPLTAAAGYALLGGFVPGPFDELIVTLASVSIVIIKYRQNLKNESKYLLSGKNTSEDQNRGKVFDIADDNPPE